MKNHFLVHQERSPRPESPMPPGEPLPNDSAFPNVMTRRSALVAAGVPNRFVYGASKAAIDGMTKAIAADFVSFGIRSNAICPGTVLTETLASKIDNSPDPEAALKTFESRQPMRRLGNVHELASLAVYLASDESAFVTGGLHRIDGGWTDLA